jgi:hypothetical protein
MSKRWKVGAGVIALAVVIGTSAALSPAAANEGGWSRGPVMIAVPIDISAATAGIPADEIESVSGYNAWCYVPWATPAIWNGYSAQVTVDYANTDDVSCTLDVRVDYCDWYFILHSCDYTRYASFSGSGGPVHVESDPPTGLGVSRTTFPNSLGWYRSPGEAQWYGYDQLSGISYCTRQRIEGPDTTLRQLSGVCVDLAGNMSSPLAFTYKYDATPPALAPSVPSPLALGATAHAEPGASDATSGVAASSCNNGAALDTSTSGTHSVTCTARDAADNTATTQASYLVGYGFGGFQDPVSDGEVNSIKAGRAVPLTFTVTSDTAGTPVLSLDASKVKVTATATACALGETPNLVEEAATGASGLQNLGHGTYRFVWASPKSYAGSCKQLRVDLGDGVAHTLEFAFTR